MFDSCTVLTEIKVDNWDMSHVTNMQNMFYHIERVKTLNLSKWNPESCENTSCMFSNDYNLTSIGNTSNWDVSKVKEAHHMFAECQKLQTLETSNWVFTSLINGGAMFYHCYALSKIDVSSFGMGNCTDIEYMFDSCYALTSLNVM